MNDNNEIRVGDKLYLKQEGRSYGCIAEVKTPYTVVSVFPDSIMIREANCVFAPNNNYYNSMPIRIEENPNGRLVELHYSNKISGGCWWAYKESVGRDYPLVAHFGEYAYYPYLD